LYRNYVLRLRAERAVGEELNQLMLDGCHVFHDYPVSRGWNINHVVVAPSGVYAIETTPSRRCAPDASAQPEGILDASTLRFGQIETAEPIEQARRKRGQARPGA